MEDMSIFLVHMIFRTEERSDNLDYFSKTSPNQVKPTGLTYSKTDQILTQTDQLLQ